MFSNKLQQLSSPSNTNIGLWLVTKRDIYKCVYLNEPTSSWFFKPWPGFVLHSEINLFVSGESSRQVARDPSCFIPSTGQFVSKRPRIKVSDFCDEFVSLKSACLIVWNWYQQQAVLDCKLTSNYLPKLQSTLVKQYEEGDKTYWSVAW